MTYHLFRAMFFIKSLRFRDRLVIDHAMDKVDLRAISTICCGFGSIFPNVLIEYSEDSVCLNPLAARY